jgi:hypothetical protein
MLLVSLVLGCGQAPNRVPVYPASGTLTHNGKAAVGAIVILHPTDPASAPVKPRGKVGEDGAFRLTTYETGDGAPAGDYAVTVYWPKAPPPGEPNNDDGPDLLGGRHLRPEKPLTRLTVHPRDNRLDPITIK